MTAENLADILKSDPRLLLAFVKRYIDTNGESSHMTFIVPKNIDGKNAI